MAMKEAIDRLEGRLVELVRELEAGQSEWLDETGAYKDWESEATEREIQGVYDGINESLAVLYAEQDES